MVLPEILDDQFNFRTDIDGRSFLSAVLKYSEVIVPAAVQCDNFPVIRTNRRARRSPLGIGEISDPVSLHDRSEVRAESDFLG